MVEGSVNSGADRSQAQALSDQIRIALRHHAWLMAWVLGYLALAALVLDRAGRSFHPVDETYLMAAVLPPVLAAGFVVFGIVLFHLLHVRPFRVSALLRDISQDDKLTLQRLIYASIPLILIVFFKSVFTAVKTAIPDLQPFAHDVTLMELDRALHFGRHPWEWLQPLLGYPAITSLVSLLYKFWFGFIYFVFFWQVFSMTDPRLRMRYLLSYVLSWSLLGSLAAIGLSSAGPCYYALVVEGPDPYAPLMEYLAQAGTGFPNWSLEAQDYLWRNFQRGGVDPASGISAMPSMHVAIATLQALLGWRIGRRVGWLTTAYCAVVMIGSVHLGWHYAVDGYVSILAVVAIWKLVGWALRFHPSFAWTAPSRKAAEGSLT